MSNSQFDSTAGETSLMEASLLKKGGYIVLGGRPCRVIELSTVKASATAELKVTGVDIFTEKKYESILSRKESVEVPNITRLDYELLLVEGEFLELLDASENIRSDIKIPVGESNKALVETIKAAGVNGDRLLVTVVTACGESHAMSAKTMM